MKIVVIGGTGLIGSKVVAGLAALGREVTAASPNTGVNTLTGEGLAEALAGARVVVDVSNSPSFEDAAAMEFFTTAGRNLAAAEQAAGVTHHLALSVVGTERLQASGYFRAKLAQERLIETGRTPWTILRSTQFLPFVGGIVQAATVEGEARLSPALVQPIAADDVAQALVELALAAPLGGMVEIGGPRALGLDDFARLWLAATGDERRVVTDREADYFGVRLEERSLVPGPDALLGKVTLEDWLRTVAPVAA